MVCFILINKTRCKEQCNCINIPKWTFADYPPVYYYILQAQALFNPQLKSLKDYEKTISETYDTKCVVTDSCHSISIYK